MATKSNCHHGFREPAAFLHLPAFLGALMNDIKGDISGDGPFFHKFVNPRVSSRALEREHASRRLELAYLLPANMSFETFHFSYIVSVSTTPSTNPSSTQHAPRHLSFRILFLPPHSTEPNPYVVLPWAQHFISDVRFNEPHFESPPVLLHMQY